MSHNLIPVVHTQLWKHRNVSKYTPQTPPTTEQRQQSSSTPSRRPSCNCRTSNSNFAAWCALHSEVLQSETVETSPGTDVSKDDDAPRTLPALQLSRSSQNEALYAGEGVYCTLSRALDHVGVSDTERTYLYQSWYEEMLTPEGEEPQKEVAGEEPLFSGTEEEKDAQFRDWVWGEFNGWVDYMYPDGSRDCLGR